MVYTVPVKRTFENITEISTNSCSWINSLSCNKVRDSLIFSRSFFLCLLYFPTLFHTFLRGNKDLSLIIVAISTCPIPRQKEEEEIKTNPQTNKKPHHHLHHIGKSNYYLISLPFYSSFVLFLLKARCLFIFLISGILPFCHFSLKIPMKKRIPECSVYIKDMLIFITAYPGSFYDRFCC